jgi:hypothetical protein
MTWLANLALFYGSAAVVVLWHHSRTLTDGMTTDTRRTTP